MGMFDVLIFFLTVALVIEKLFVIGYIVAEATFSASVGTNLPRQKALNLLFIPFFAFYLLWYTLPPEPKKERKQ